MTTLNYAVFYLEGSLTALPTGTRTASEVDAMTGDINWYGVAANSPNDAIEKAKAAGFKRRPSAELLTLKAVAKNLKNQCEEFSA